MHSRRESTKPPALALVVAAGLTLASALTGCPNPGGARPSPTTSVSPIQTPGPTVNPAWSQPTAPLDGAYSDAGYAVFGGSLAVEALADGQPARGAMFKVYGPTLATATADPSGRANFGPLAPGPDYRLVVTHDGRATFTSAPFEIKKKQTVNQRATLAAGAVVKGRVSAAGAPVVGAVVSDGTTSTLSGADGSYELRGVTPGSVTLTAGKPRFSLDTKSLTATAGQPATADLTLAATAPVAFLDTSISAGVGADRLAALRQHLGSKGWQLQDAAPREGVWVVISPGRDLTGAEVERMTTFVAQGGKLVVFGEWGGFGGFRTPGANALVHRFGLHFNPDLLREPPQAGGDAAWLSVARFKPDVAAIADLKAVQLYQSCSLFGLSPMTELAQTGQLGYRVQAGPQAGAHTVAAGGPYKGGKAVVVGDASAFSDDDTDGDQIPNAAEAENLRFVERLLDW